VLSLVVPFWVLGTFAIWWRPAFFTVHTAVTSRLSTGQPVRHGQGHSWNEKNMKQNGKKDMKDKKEKFVVCHVM
jgi:hypothetical protein